MIYGYVRVSTDKQSTENQRFEIENYSKAKGFRIERWVDETISGTTNVSDRQLGRLLKQIRKGDTLVTTELSRLGRNLMQVMSFLHQCMERDIIVQALIVLLLQVCHLYGFVLIVCRAGDPIHLLFR